MNGAIHSPGRSPASVIRSASARIPDGNLSLASQSPTARSQPSSTWTTSKGRPRSAVTSLVSCSSVMLS